MREICQQCCSLSLRLGVQGLPWTQGQIWTTWLFPPGMRTPVSTQQFSISIWICLFQVFTCIIKSRWIAKGLAADKNKWHARSRENPLLKWEFLATTTLSHVFWSPWRTYSLTALLEDKAYSCMLSKMDLLRQWFSWSSLSNNCGC